MKNKKLIVATAIASLSIVGGTVLFARNTSNDLFAIKGGTVLEHGISFSPKNSTYDEATSTFGKVTASGNPIYLGVSQDSRFEQDGYNLATMPGNQNAGYSGTSFDFYTSKDKNELFKFQRIDSLVVTSPLNSMAKYTMKVNIYGAGSDGEFSLIKENYMFDSNTAPTLQLASYN